MMHALLLLRGLFGVLQRAHTETGNLLGVLSVNCKQHFKSFYLYSYGFHLLFPHRTSLLMRCCVLMQKTGRAPTPQEIAHHLEQPVTRVLLCLRKAQRPINLDAQTGDSERDSMVDQLAASIDEDGADSGLGSLQHR